MLGNLRQVLRLSRRLWLHAAPRAGQHQRAVGRTGGIGRPFREGKTQDIIRS